MIKFIVFFILIPLATLGQTIKEDAIASFKEIVKCYYDKDCIKFYSFWSDSISTLNIDSNNKYPFPISILQNVNNENCTLFDKIIEETKSFANYMSNYEIKAITYDEFKFEDRTELLKQWEPIKKSNGGWILVFITLFNKYYHPDDVLVIGDVPKNSSGIIGKPFIFLLRKTNTKWKIIGILN